MVSQAAEYALRATVFLAGTDRTTPVSVGELAEALGAPRNYLSKILGTLARGGVLSSVRGPAGGFTLAVVPAELSLARIVGVFDAPPGGRCLLGRRQCSDANACAAHPLWKGVSAQIDGFFGRTTIAQLLEASPSAASGDGESGGQGGQSEGVAGAGRRATETGTRAREVQHG